MKSTILVVLLLIYTPFSWGWGRRGHSIVCQTGAYLIAQEKENSADFLKQHSFDLGYYCNVPDIIWKRPETYTKERINHFVNLDVFEEVFKKKNIKEIKTPYKLNRQKFNKRFKEISTKKGRVFWRINELQEKLSDVTKNLNKKKLPRQQKHALQKKWLTLAGVTGHYIGDLAMPLHVSSNYDGQKSGQKGIHSYFESKMVNELFLQDGFNLEGEVFKKAQSLKEKNFKKFKEKSWLDFSFELAKDSESKIEELLKKDKSIKRSNVKNASVVFKELLVERLALGSVYYAWFLKKHLGWSYDGRRFYEFNETPKYIKAP